MRVARTWPHCKYGYTSAGNRGALGFLLIEPILRERGERQLICSLKTKKAIWPDLAEPLRKIAARPSDLCFMVRLC